MNSPCVRIEIEYADGSRQVAEGDHAEAVIDWLRRFQALAAEQVDLWVLQNLDSPQLTFLPAPPITAIPQDLDDADRISQ